MLSVYAVKNAVRKNDCSMQKNACIIHRFLGVIFQEKQRRFPQNETVYAVKKKGKRTIPTY